MVVEKITALLNEKFSEEAFSDCFLIDINLHPGKHKLEVFIDSDTGVTFEECRQISRYLESYLDEEGWLGENYVLEVSSPGVSRPLELPRQYYKHIGRKLEVKLREGGAQTGTLKAVSGEAITLEEKIRVKEGKKKTTKIVETNIPFPDIRSAIVKITFK